MEGHKKQRKRQLPVDDGGGDNGDSDDWACDGNGDGVTAVSWVS